jgi:hypothetical protein
MIASSPHSTLQSFFKVILICRAERLAILLRNREFLGSNLGPEIDYPDEKKKIHGFPQSLQANSGVVF